MPVATRLEHSPRDLLAINTDAMDAVLQHHSQRAAAGPGRAGQLDALASDEDTAEGLASRLELQLWLDTYAHEAEQYRSVGIACELLFERARAACAPLRSPHLLTTAVSMTLLSQLAPQFRSAAGLSAGIVDELGQAIYVSPQRCTHLSRAAQCFGVGTYFDAFYRLVSAFHAQKAKAEKFALIQARGKRVLERAVTLCRRGHAKRMLRKWHLLTQHHQALRRKYRKLFSQVSDNSIAEDAIHRWRQHAHRVMISYLTRHNRKGVAALQEVQKAHRSADETLRAAQFEATRREAEAAESRSNLDMLKAKLQATKNALAAGHATYTGARRQWAGAAGQMFNDARRVPADCSAVQWMRDVWADQIVCPPDAATRTMGPNRLSALALLEVLEALADNTGRKRNLPRTLLVGSRTTNAATSAAVEDATAVAERVLALYGFLTRGLLPPPIGVADLVRADQPRLRQFAAHLMELGAGGHLSLFQENALPLPTAIAVRSRLGDDPVGGGVASDHEVATMTEDWRDAVVAVTRSSLLSDVTVQAGQAARETVQLGDQVDLSHAARALYDHIAFGGSVRREHLEPALQRLFYLHRESVPSLWPAAGISTVSEFSEYVCRVAAHTETDRVKTLRLLHTELAVASPLSFLFDVLLDETQAVLRSFDDDIRGLFDLCVDDGKTFTKAAAAKAADHIMKNVSVHLPPADVDAMYDAIAALMPDVGRSAMTTFLTAVTVYFEPSPFTPLHGSLRIFLRTLFRS